MYSINVISKSTDKKTGKQKAQIVIKGDILGQPGSKFTHTKHVVREAGLWWDSRGRSYKAI